MGFNCWLGLSHHIDEAKVVQCKQSKTRRLFTTSHQQADAQPLPGKRGVGLQNSYMGRQTP